jgi:hypothetical protein
MTHPGSIETTETNQNYFNQIVESGEFESSCLLSCKAKILKFVLNAEL